MSGSRPGQWAVESRKEEDKKSYTESKIMEFVCDKWTISSHILILHNILD